MSCLGVLLSEAPLGCAPEPWRFPARNRLIAALSDVVVIVESCESGGSLITAEYADQRGRTLLAVPGSALSPASVGTHDLLRTRNAELCTSAADVMVALELPNRVSPNTARLDDMAKFDDLPSDDHAMVVGLVGWEPTRFEDLARLVPFSLPKLAGIVEDLVSLGLCLDLDGFVVRTRRTPQSLNGGKNFP